MFTFFFGLLALSHIAQYWPYYLAGFLLVLFLCIFIPVRRARARKRAYQAALAQAEAARRAQEAARQKAEAEAREQDRRIKAEMEAEQQRALLEPFDAPRAQSGYILRYSYPDVKFKCPPMCLSAAKAVPPHKQLTFQAEDSGDVQIYYNGAYIGDMYPGKLRDMLLDFSGTHDKTFLAISCHWDSTPVFSLFFYLSADEYVRRNPDARVCKLSGTAGKKAQETLEYLGAGDTLDIDYDDDKEKYVLSSSDDPIGYLPAKHSEWLSSHPGCSAMIVNIDTNENGKFTVEVLLDPGE